MRQVPKIIGILQPKISVLNPNILRMLQIFCKNNNISRSFQIGSSLLEIYEALNLQIPYGPVSCKVNNKVESLDFRVFHSKDVEFLNILCPSGMRTYVRSLCFVLCAAVEELFPQGRIYLEHPVSKGYYCTLDIGRPVTERDLQRIRHKMHQMVAARLRFVRHERHTTDVAALFRRRGMEDKATLLETSGELYSSYYTLGDTPDYYYGSLVPDTGYLHTFDVVPYYEGILLRIPNREHPEELEPVTRQDKMLEVFREHRSWNRILGINTVGDFNKACAEGHATDLINVSEALQEKSIARIADQIAARNAEGKGVRMVLISGPVVLGQDHVQQSASRCS